MTARDLFDYRNVTLEYRPVINRRGEATWYWVLIPSSAHKALACGSAKERGLASIQARNKARHMGKRIVKVVTRRRKPQTPAASAEACSA